MVTKKDLLIQLNELRNLLKTFYTYFVFTFTSSLQFYMWLLLSGLALFVASLVVGFSGTLIKGLLTVCLLTWLLHSVHGFIHIVSDYVYNKLTKQVLSTLFTLILLKGSYLIFFI